MADQPVAEIAAPKAFVTFKRSVAVRPYETATAEVMIEVPTEPFGWVNDGKVDVDAMVADLKPAFFAAKAAVFEQLGIDVTVDLNTLVVHELADELGAVELTESEAQHVAQAASAAKQARPPRAANGNVPEAPAKKEDLWRELAEHPEYYLDQRKTKQGNQPDFKRVDGKGALWLTFKGANQVPDDVEVPESGFATASK